MKHLRETFTDQEFTRIKQVKDAAASEAESGRLSWHDFIIMLTDFYCDIENEFEKTSEVKE